MPTRTLKVIGIDDDAAGTLNSGVGGSAHVAVHLAARTLHGLVLIQLQQLKDMGFFDEAQNIRALQATFGNVSAAIERLLQ